MNSCRRKSTLAVCMMLVLIGNMMGCQMVQQPEGGMSDTEYISVQTDQIKDNVQIDDISVIDNMDIYSQDDPDSIAWFYVTVRYGSKADSTDHTLNEVNNAVRFADGSHIDTNIMARALVQAGDENGPHPGMLGYGETKNNATIRIRGNTNSLHPQKSYRLKLNNNAGLWRGQSNIALNKHGYDVTRLRNKLYFDILKEIDAVPSLRTQFVVMYLKDETSGQTEFENYGLFTQVEVPTGKYLANHGMDSNGYLYKAINFNFELHDAIRNLDDPAYDGEAMEMVISSRGKEGNEKLIELLTVIEDSSVDIDYIINTYFDRDNYEYWLAYNILMGNLDTTMQNFYLYSPLNGNKWYFIPWDGDDSLTRIEDAYWNREESYAEWESGITNYWHVILHQRFLKYEKNRKELEEKVDELHSWINKAYIDEMVQNYNEAIEPYINQMPDVLNLNASIEERREIIDILGDGIEQNYRLFKESLTSLMPFFLYEVTAEEDKIVFAWGDAYDFDAQKITYKLTVSVLPDMASPILEVEGLEVPGYEAPKELFENGYYYWRVEALAEDGRTVASFNKSTVGERTYHGVMEFYIGVQ